MKKRTRDFGGKSKMIKSQSKVKAKSKKIR